MADKQVESPGVFSWHRLASKVYLSSLILLLIPGVGWPLLSSVCLIHDVQVYRPEIRRLKAISVDLSALSLNDLTALKDKRLKDVSDTGLHESERQWKLKEQASQQLEKLAPWHPVSDACEHPWEIFLRSLLALLPAVVLVVTKTWVSWLLR